MEVPNVRNSGITFTFTSLLHRGHKGQLGQSNPPDWFTEDELDASYDDPDHRFTNAAILIASATLTELTYSTNATL